MADTNLQSTADTLAEKLKQAAEGLVTVKVRTLVGDASFAANASDANITVAQGTQGAYTACNMATGDIVLCYSDAVMKPEGVKALHDEAVALGTKIFTDNLTLLKNLLLDITDKLRQG